MPSHNPPVLVNCVGCGAEILARRGPSIKEPKKYCTHACYSQAKRKRPDPGPVTCAGCGAPMKPTRGQKRDLASGDHRHAFCSRACLLAHWGDVRPRREAVWNWRGGRQIKNGYVRVLVEDSAGSRYVAEHRLVAEATLGRPLLPSEVPHHINGVRTDNRPENLVVMDMAEHSRMHSALRRQARSEHNPKSVKE